MVGFGWSSSDSDDDKDAPYGANVENGNVIPSANEAAHIIYFANSMHNNTLEEVTNEGDIRPSDHYMISNIDATYSTQSLSTIPPSCQASLKHSRMIKCLQVNKSLKRDWAFM